MNRKLSALTLGLAAAALIVTLISPVCANARYLPLQCGQDPCFFRLSGQALELNFGGSRIRCPAVTGQGSFNRLNGLSVLNFQNCRERVTVFNFRCSSSVARVGPVHTSPMGMQLKWGAEKAPKIVFLGLRAKFRCAQALNFYVEGFLIGHLNRAQCNTKSSEYPIEPVLFAHGGIGNEPAYDIYVDANAKTYKVPTPWQMKFRQQVTVRC